MARPARIEPLKLENLPDVLTAKQVAEVLQITEWMAYDLAAKGKLEAIKFSTRCVRFPKRPIARLLGLDKEGALVDEKQPA